MSAVDPYQPPAVDLVKSADSEPTEIAVTDNMVASLLGTRPWLLFLAILGFVGAGLMAVGAVIMLVLGVVAGASDSGSPAPYAGFVVGAGAVFYALIAIVYVLPCIPLFRSAKACGRLRYGEEASAIEDAVTYQKSFWRTMGIIAIVTIALYVVFFIVGMVAIVIAAAVAGA